jgi:alpha-maltose-1-phosphate synthase
MRSEPRSAFASQEKAPPETLKIAHLLRKYDPGEWGGTETAVKRLCDGLRSHSVQSAVYCPRIEAAPEQDPLSASGHAVKRFRACVPVWGISREQKRQLIAVGGNLLSFDLIGALWAAPDLSLIHAHTHNRIGGIGLIVAKLRHIPLVVTIHGGVLDLPQQTKEYLLQPLRGGIEWGRIFGWIVRSRRVLQEADALFTCNRREADLWRAKLPHQRIVVQPHSVPVHTYETDHRAAALAAFPELAGKRVLLTVGRIDPVKNQLWLVEQLPEILRHFPEARLVFAGACTDSAYGQKLKARIEQAGLEDNILLTGGLPPADPRLIGLFQCAEAVVVPSLQETFGIVILEAWAAGKAVIATRTSGALELVSPDENGWLFELSEPESFHAILEAGLKDPCRLQQAGACGNHLVRANYDVRVLGGQVRRLYEQLIEEKNAIRHTA